MKKTLLGTIAGLAMFASAANAQCSAWDNSMAIAATLGDPNVISETFLSNDAVFICAANSTDGVAGFVVDGYDVKMLEFWDEDENGTAVLFDPDGNTCTVACSANGGIVVTIEGLTFDTLSWDVKADGRISMPGDVCGCSGGPTSATQNVPCNAVNCRNTARCRPGTPGGYCQAGPVPN